MDQLFRMQRFEIPRISQGTKKAWMKFVSLRGDTAWYVTEFDGKDLCYGLIAGSDQAWGYFSLRELSLMRNEQGVPIEMDPNWIPQDIE